MGPTTTTGRSSKAAERAAILDLRQRGKIGDQTWRHVERELDLERLRLEG
jgi:hypothetical protein